MVAALLMPAGLAAQASGVLTVSVPARTILRRGGTAVVKISLQIRSGYHINSHVPNDEFLIPLRLRWDDTGPLKAARVTYSTPELRRYGFSEQPVSVFTGAFSIFTRFEAAAGAAAGRGVLTGRLRYQACDASSCLPPRTIEVRLPYEIR